MQQKKKKLKELYLRFKAWQQEPIHYKNKCKGTVRCINCGMEFSDNFCPRCGQDATVRRLDWQSVRKGISLLWGMESRLLPATLLQLLFRPGYLVSDYLRGKRQLSYPPMKMLIILALVNIIILKSTEFFFPEIKTVANEEISLVLWTKYLNWMKESPGWAMLTINSLFILPTWLVFRHAPRYYFHTLPEGFFLQVFLSSLMLLFDIFPDSIGNIMFIYYPVAYYQLFGYGMWGTLWRLSITFIVASFSLLLILIVAEYLIGKYTINHDRAGNIFMLLFLLSVFIGIFLAVVNYINVKTDKRLHQAK